jgi:hypothetical protein
MRDIVNSTKDKGLAFLLGLLNLAGVARLELATIGFGDRNKTKQGKTSLIDISCQKSYYHYITIR